MSIKYRIYRINNDIEIINAAFDYKDKKTGKYYDYIWEHEAKDKAYELNQRVENPEVEFWYRAIEEDNQKAILPPSWFTEKQDPEATQRLMNLSAELRNKRDE